MSGGHFDYQQYKIDDIADSIQDYIEGHELEDGDVEYLKHEYERWHGEQSLWEIEHKHTMPNPYEFSDHTLEEFRKGVRLLRMAAIYAQRIDWLLSGDDGEDTFHERLKEDLKNNGYEEDSNNSSGTNSCQL